VLTIRTSSLGEQVSGDSVRPRWGQPAEVDAQAAQLDDALVEGGAAVGELE